MDKSTFTYEWTIQNFYCQLATNGEMLPHTKFEFDYGPEVKFCAEMYLNGDECSKRECILILKSTTHTNWKVDVGLEIGDGTSAESLGIVLLNKSNIINNKASWSLKLPQRPCVLIKHLRNDAIITMTCKITYYRYSYRHPLYFANMTPSDARISCRIERKFTYKWTIENFYCSEVRIGEDLPCKTFKFNLGPDVEFTGILRLAGDTCREMNCILCLQCNTKDDWKVWVDLGFGDDNVDSYGMAINKTDNKKICELFDSNLNNCILNKHRQNNAFTITCIITYVTYKQYKNANFGANVTFVVEGHEIRVHKSVLADQSEAFASMFRRETDECNKITLNDVSMAVFQKMLCFMYTGKVGDVTLELLAACDIYDLPHLKKELEAKASLENKVEILNPKSEMSLTKLKTCDASHSCRMERKFTYKWTLENNDFWKNDLPRKTFEFNLGPDLQFTGTLRFNGDICQRNNQFYAFCRKKTCTLHLQCNTVSNWKVWVDLCIGDDMSGKYSASVNSASESVVCKQPLNKSGECPMYKYNKNQFTITCIITGVIYEQKKLSSFPPTADLNENKMIPTNLIISDASCISRTEKTFTYDWKIENFGCQKETNGENLPSTEFEINVDSDEKFVGRLYLRGDCCVSTECVFVLKSKPQTISNVLVALKESFLSTQPLFKSSSTAKTLFSTKCLLPKSLSNNTSIVTCTIYYTIYEEKSLSTIHPTDLYETKMNCDVIFVVEGYELHAHKFIVKDCSKVFAAMFEPQVEEAKTNIIFIKDIDFDVFQEMLSFIYMGKVSKTSWELLAASDKYELPQLKMICENELKFKVSNETAAETLMMADLNNALQLKDHTIIYIKDNLVAVTETEGWRKLVKNHPNLLAAVWK